MPGLKIESISFSNFRNYHALKLDSVGELVIFTGRNAVGKTNILEGINLLTSASSFRHAQISQLIMQGTSEGRVSMKAGDGNRSLEVSLALKPGKRAYSVNGKAKHAADVRGVLPAVAFTPDDLQLAKKSSAVKRAALDDLGMQLTRNYHIVSRDYEKTVRYKNRLLHDEAPDALVESINETLVTCGSQLACYRRRLFSRMVPHVECIYEQLTAGEGKAERFSASYELSWIREFGKDDPNPAGEDSAELEKVDIPQMRSLMERQLERHLKDERRRGRCLVGPHNDGVVFALDGRDASQYASQGQQRSIVLAWKLAEVEMVQEVLGVKPVLLLDDVLSELDGHRREMLVGFVTADVQTFMTATDLDGFAPELLERARVVPLPLGGERS